MLNRQIKVSKFHSFECANPKLAYCQEVGTDLLPAWSPKQTHLQYVKKLSWKTLEILENEVFRTPNPSFDRSSIRYSRKYDVIGQSSAILREMHAIADRGPYFSPDPEFIKIGPAYSFSSPLHLLGTGEYFLAVRKTARLALNPLDRP